jgi:hypothetical protein
MISPILLYGSEVGGFSETQHIEKVQNKFCKFVLGVPVNTPTLAVLAETGRYPMYVQYYSRLVKYWLKLLSMPPNRYPRACYDMLFSLDQAGRSTWASSVRQLLVRFGFQNVWEAQQVENSIIFLREFKCKVKQAYVAEWEHEVAQCSKLSLYRQLKTDGILRQSYLYNVTIKSYRSGLAKLRCSAHKLRIETGRHCGELLAERVCSLCLRHNGVYVLEDEYHFMLNCPAYLDLRETYLKDYVRALPDQQKYETFLNLLGSTDETVQLKVAGYIFQANKLRSMLLKDA